MSGLCAHAGEVIEFLESIGTVFSVDEAGRPLRRAFGGQSHKRTYYCGSSTGKQIVSALVMEVRRFEAQGTIRRRLWTDFHSALIHEGVCYGVLLFNERRQSLEPAFADAVVVATGGQNALFGKTTGSMLCDGYAAGRLFMQGVLLKNLEFIQYHPTTLETAHKRMLVSEAARGEGGRLFYHAEDGRRVYFMEEEYGPRGNLMTRDVVSRAICATGKDVYLDVSFLDKSVIDRRLPEVRDLCKKYRNIDIACEPIPVAPSVHFFMGGLAVHPNHETSIANLFAVGECASIYHGANRLGGNSLLAAVYGGAVAADAIAVRPVGKTRPDFERTIGRERGRLRLQMGSRSLFPVAYLRDMLAQTMNEDLGIVRERSALEHGLLDIDHSLAVAPLMHFDRSVSLYTNYSLIGILTLARATLTCALARRESRGAHYRSDYPQADAAWEASTLISHDEGAYRVWLDREGVYES